jgi:hypothetical protein
MKGDKDSRNESQLPEANVQNLTVGSCLDSKVPSESHEIAAKMLVDSWQIEPLVSYALMPSRFRVCVESETLGNTYVGRFLVSQLRVYWGEKYWTINFDTRNGAVRGRLHCERLLWCLNDRGDFFDINQFERYVNAAIAAVVNNPEFVSTVGVDLKNYIATTTDHFTRHTFGRYFHQKFILARSESADWRRLLLELNATVGAIKTWFVLAVPGIWAKEDAIRILIGGSDEQALVNKRTVDAMLACPTVDLCNNDLLASVTKQLPFWWSAAVSPVSPFERFADVVDNRVALLTRLIQEGIDWKKSAAGYHPIIFSTAVRFKAFAGN